MTTAADLVTALEKLQPGQPWTEPMRAAELAIVAERDAATTILFPAELVPLPADAISDYAWRTGRLTAPSYADKLAELHRRAVRTHPALAAILRSPEALDDAAAAAASLATPDFAETHTAAGEKAGAAARARYALLIAHQLAAVEGHELGDAARALVALEDLAARIAPVRERHEQHERDEANRVAAERRAALAAADAAADQAAVEVELEERARMAGLPAGIRTGFWYESQREHVGLLVTVKRRLQSTSVDAVRIGLRGSGRGLYGCKDLVHSLGGCNIDELKAILEQLDRAEGREVAS